MFGGAKARADMSGLISVDASGTALFGFEGAHLSMRGRSSDGRAPALQAGGQEFNSPRLHHFIMVGGFSIFTWAYSSAG